MKRREHKPQPCVYCGKHTSVSDATEQPGVWLHMDCSVELAREQGWNTLTVKAEA